MSASLRGLARIGVFVISAAGAGDGYTARAEAECVGLPVCAARAEATFVFIADVIEAGPVERPVGPGQFRLGPQIVRFKVVERFKGLAAGRREITARIFGTGAETVFLRASIRYVVYAKQRRDGTWDTSCSRTRPLAEAGDEARE